MATEAQIEANRRNAQLSTGPRTPEGKAESALNGHNHISLARSVVLKTESPERFCGLVADFYAEYQPRTPTERALVEMMATARWRQVRMHNLEAVEVTVACDRQSYHDTDEIGADQMTADAYKESIKASRVLDFYGRSEIRHQRLFDRALARFTQLRCCKVQQTKLSEAELSY